MSGRHTPLTGGAPREAAEASAAATAEEEALRTSLLEDELLSTFQITRSSYLEYIPNSGGVEMDEWESGAISAADSVSCTSAVGGGRELVVAVEFDAVESVGLALDAGCQPATEEEIERSAVAVTLAGDGGPVRRSSMTVFTLTVSSELLDGGRTPLIPILFLLGGEQAIHSAVGVRLRAELKRALRASYIIPITPIDTPGAVYRSTAVLTLPYFIYVCGDFAMVCHLLALTGCGDLNRCPYRWPCLPADYLPSLLLDDAGDSVEETREGARDGKLLSQHWELVVWSLARWCTLRNGNWRAAGGLVRWACRRCRQDIVALSSSTSILSCVNQTCLLHDEPQAPLLPSHSYSPLSDFYRLLRRRLGGLRGYPLLGDIPFLIQAPVLHCTGKISKGLMFFLLARISPQMRVVARSHIYAVMGRSNLGGMYLREFGRLGAMAVSLPGILGKDVTVDGGATVMLPLSQALTAAWRRAIGTRTEDERESAAVALQLLAGVLSPIYATLKPLDPITKKAGVFNLYLHTALAHVRSTVGGAFASLKRICDDNIEGVIAALNRYFNMRTNNVSRCQSLINKEAMAEMGFHEPDGRQPAEQLLLTEEIVVCPCVARLGPSVKDGLTAVVCFACREAAVSVAADFSMAVLEQSVASVVANAEAATAASAEALSAADAASDVAAAAAAVVAECARRTAATVGAAVDLEGREVDVGGGMDDHGLTPMAALEGVATRSERAATAAAATAKQAATTMQAAIESLVGVVPFRLKLLLPVDKIRVAKSGEPASMEIKLQESLMQVQHRMKVCLCGTLTGREPSKVAEDAVAAAEEAAEEAEASSDAATAASAAATTIAAAAAATSATAAAAAGTPTTATTAATTVAAARIFDAATGRDDALSGDCDGGTPAVATAAVADNEEVDELEVGDGHEVPSLDEPAGLAVFEGDNGQDTGPSVIDDRSARPVEGDRFFGLSDEDLAAIESEDDEDGADPCCHTFRRKAQGESSRGAFLLQAAVDDDGVALMLPAHDAVNALMGGAGAAPARNSPDASLIRDKLDEDLMMMQLFIARMHTPEFLSWAGRDGVLLADMALAAQRLRHSLVCALVDLEGHGEGDGGETLA